MRPSTTPVCSKAKTSCMTMTSPSMPWTSVMFVILRVPSRMRDWCTMRSTAEAICSRMARSGRSMPAISTIVSRRASMSRGLLEWPVDIEPSWPVFMAWSMSSASPPRHSPTMMRSGRMRSELRTSSRMGIAPLPSMFGRPRLERHDVLLAELELGGVLDRDDALVVGDERREHVERRRLAGAGAARDEDVEAGLDAGLQEVEHLRRRGAEADEVVDRERRGGELADGEHRPDQRERRDDGVDARAVGQAGVDHRAGLVDAAADRRDDAVDDAHHVVVVLERDVRQLELAAPLDVDLARPVDHDLGDGLVAQQRLERTEADDLVGDLLEHADALGAREGEALLVDRDAEDLLDLAAHLDLVGEVELRVEVGDDALLDAELRVAERLADRDLRQHALAASSAAADDGRAGSAGPTGRRRRHGWRTGEGRPGPVAPAGRALSILFSSDMSASP